MRKSQILLSLIFVLSSVIPSYGAMQQYTRHAWNLLLDVKQGRLSISHTQLGVVIKDVVLNLQKEGRLAPLSDWNVEDRDANLLAVTTSNPAASTWEFVVAPNGIAVRSSAANSVIAGFAPAPMSRFPARIAEPDKMQSFLSDEGTDYTGAKLYEKMYVPGEASHVMYLALGLVEARNLHSLFDRPQLLATNRHITGAFSVQKQAWDASSQMLTGTSQTVPDAQYSLFIHVPGGWTVKKVHASAESVTHRIGPDGVLHISFLGQRAPANWSVTFAGSK